MIVLGIDCGMTRKNPTGLALIRWGVNERIDLFNYDRITPPPKTTWDKSLLYIMRQMAQIMNDWGRIDGIAYELPHVATNPQAAIKLAHVCGLIVATSVYCNIPVIGIQPSEAKKALTGKGNASKDEMIAAAQQQFGLSLPKDVADACGIALAGIAKYRKG